MGDNTDVVTLGELLLEMGELEQAGQFFGLMVTQQIKEGNLDTVWLHNSIGSLHLARSNFFMAKTLFKYCLTMTEDFDSPALERALLNNLGLAYLEQARYHRALKYLKRARKITATEDEMMDIYSNIGSVYCYQGKYRKAKRYLRRTLAIEQKNLPSLHYSVARTYNNLGSLEMQMGNYVEALNWHEQALKIYRQTVPSNHPSLAHALNNIGTTYSAMEQFDRARELYEQALQVLMISFEPNRDENLLVLQILSNLGTIQYEQNNYQAAEATFQRVLNLKLNIPGIGDQARHPSLAIAYNNLAMVQAKLGLFKEASTNYAHALDIEQSIGNAAALAITYNNLGGVHLEQNDFVNAERFFVQAYDTALTILPKEHPDIQLYQHNIEKTKMK
jgi:tetratricopeptide (TPR) repeat protein